MERWPRLGSLEMVTQKLSSFYLIDRFASNFAHMFLNFKHFRAASLPMPPNLPVFMHACRSGQAPIAS